MWMLELRWKLALLGLSQDKGVHEQAQIFFQEFFVHS